MRQVATNTRTTLETIGRPRTLNQWWASAVITAILTLGLSLAWTLPNARRAKWAYTWPTSENSRKLHTINTITTWLGTCGAGGWILAIAGTAVLVILAAIGVDATSTLAS